jgi:hypothetical protein
MSYVENRQTGPEIYNYAANTGVGNYSAQNQPIQTVNVQKTSNV